MMNRREFIRNLAVLTVGASALPEQIDTLEKIITINAIPNVNTGLICIDEINIIGIDKISHPMLMEVFTNGKPDLNIRLNLFGGIYRWVAVPNHCLRVSTLENIEFHIRNVDTYYRPQAGLHFSGGFRYINQNGLYESMGFENLKYEFTAMKVTGRVKL